MKIYPVAPKTLDSKYGSQRFADDYVPVALDTSEAAAARMLAVIDQPRYAVLAAGLDGSDEVGTVTDILDEILAEAVVWRGVDPSKYATADDYEDALVGKHLDASKWREGLLAERGVASFDALRIDALEK